MIYWRLIDTISLKGRNYRRMRRQMQIGITNQSVALRLFIHYCTERAQLAAHKSQHSNNSKKQKLLLFKRCHRPSLCTGLIKSSLVDKLLIQNLKKKFDTLYYCVLIMSSIFPVCLLSHQASAIPLPVFRGGNEENLGNNSL